MTVPTWRNYMAFRQFGPAAAVTAALAFATPAHAVTEIQWWHAMTGGNNDIVNKLAEEFNASQSDYKVVPSYKGSYPDTMNAGIAAFRAGNAPHIMPIGTKANGLDGFDTELKFNSPLHVKHLQNLVDLQKDKTYDYGGRTSTNEARFGSGECAIFLTSSGYYGTAKATAKFDFTSAPMPYYPDVQGAPQNSIIGGASLWVMGGKKPEEYKGVAKFFAFLSDTNRQARLHQESGYLPITKAAYEKNKAAGFYKDAAYLETPLLELTNKEPTENSRGLRFGNMVQMRDVWAEEIEAALNGQKSAKDALDAAVSRGNQMLRQ